jgi:hypothetical protein
MHQEFMSVITVVSSTHPSIICFVFVVYFVVFAFCQVIPMEEPNLHLTGDIHSILIEESAPPMLPTSI